MDNIRSIVSFIHTVNAGSFSAAARRLAISPAAVSQNVRRLEDQLETRLLARTTRRLQLTESGQLFYDHCAAAIQDLEHAEQLIVDRRQVPQGRLRVSSTTAFGRQSIIPLLPMFYERYPQIEVELVLDDRFTDLIDEGFDVALRGGVLPSNSYISRLLVPITPLVCGSPVYLRDHTPPITPAMLADHRCINFRLNPSQQLFQWEFQVEGQLLTQAVSGPLIVNDPEAAVLAAAAGLGLAQIGSNLVLPLVKAGKLITALDDYATQSRGIYAVYPSRRHLPLKVRVWVDYLIEHFAARTDLTRPAPKSKRATKRRV